MLKKIGLYTLTSYAIIGCVATSGPVKITGANDTLEEKIEISTFGYERPFMGVVNPSDHYFRGYVDKKTGNKTYQLYTITNSTGWMRWNEIRFRLNGNLEKLKASVIATDAKCSAPICAHYEDVVVGLSREMLGDWATSNNPFLVRYSSSHVSDTIDIKINKQELMDFISKMDSITTP